MTEKEIERRMCELVRKRGGLSMDVNGSRNQALERFHKRVTSNTLHRGATGQFHREYWA